MSAYVIQRDWRAVRASAALQGCAQQGRPIDFEYYAEEFGIDLDEAIELFSVASRELGIPLTIIAAPAAPAVPLYLLN
ncbi:hypothetical protein [Burkholderia anthina]|uniref:hypothetical protein n=1 Tax=Burkholderia anthina TaxID=179879 RepID=UPI00158CBF46|nr:hypothetical protein [Burkholderia anthina]